MSTKNSMPNKATLTTDGGALARMSNLQQIYGIESAPYRFPLNMPFLGLIPQPGIATATQAVGQAQLSRFWEEYAGTSRIQREEFERQQELRRRQMWGEPYRWRFIPYSDVPTRIGGYWQQFGNQQRFVPYSDFPTRIPGYWQQRY